MVKRLLLIDDNVEELPILQRKLKEVEIHWLPSVGYGVKLLKEYGERFDFTVIDFFGTSLPGFFEDEIKKIPKSNLYIVTSSVATPHSSNFPFILKDELIGHVKEKLGL